jgi:hypothetical protein
VGVKGVGEAGGALGGEVVGRFARDGEIGLSVTVFRRVEGDLLIDEVAAGAEEPTPLAVVLDQVDGGGDVGARIAGPVGLDEGYRGGAGLGDGQLGRAAAGEVGGVPADDRGARRDRP